jgi:2-polyprenyl-3-methyl-5-hydroxy-6-metoxy-1,4-benzoquinol methylase
MDYPNDWLQVQLYAHVLEALGTLAGKSLLDAGCGWGRFTLIANILGASPVGVDFVAETVKSLRVMHPAIRWEHAELTDRAQMSGMGVFDRVVALEVLQHMDFESAVRSLWDLVAPGGRLVACVPNARCPIASGVNQRMPQWIPVSPEQIIALRAFPGCSAVFMKGLTYVEDQSMAPYAVSGWAKEISGTPNRIVFAMLRDS